MDNSQDLVSVIIPTYNRAHMIKRSAESVLNQSYSNLELIIVDDGSTDNTEEIVKSINDNRVRYIKQHNQGACAARNNGINCAKGVFIAFQDSDDVWHPKKLEIQLDILKKNRVDLCFCRMAINGDVKKIFPKNFNEGLLQQTELPLGASTQTLCAYTKVFKTDLFDIEMPRFQDFEIMLRIQKKFSIYLTNQVLVDYYLQEDSISSNQEKFLKAWELIKIKHPDIKDHYPKHLNQIARVILYWAFTSKNKSTKQKLIKEAFYYSKTLTTILIYILHWLRLYKIIKKIRNYFVVI